MKFQKIIDKIPDYQRFFSVDEFDQRSQELAKQYPEVCKCYTAGYSRAGHPILVLQIGTGSKNVLWFGCPHPNEPIGAMMLDYLSSQLVANSELLDSLDCTWHIIKVIDPDGTKLNEGWFKQADSLEAYIRNFYRPAGFEQIEWTFPVEYKTLSFQKPLPETKVLMNLIDQYQPEFMYSLHNAGFGGAYYYISHEIPALYERMQKIPGDFKIPLALGEAELPFFKHLAPAIFRLFETKDIYDHLAKHTTKDPAVIIDSGASSDEYASRVSDTFTLVCEVPYYYDQRVTDLTSLNITRAESLLAANKSQKKLLEFVASVFNISREYLDQKSPFFNPLNKMLETGQDSLEAELKWIDSAEELKRFATVAENFDNTCSKNFYQLLAIGMLNRLLKAALSQNPDQQILIDEQQKVEDYLQQGIKQLEASLNYSAIPIKTLIGIQLTAGLEIMDYILNKDD